MSDNDNGSDNSSKNPSDELILNVDRTKFGSLRPLTAPEVVAALLYAESSLGACACACACACGPCY